MMEIYIITRLISSILFSFFYANRNVLAFNLNDFIVAIVAVFSKFRSKNLALQGLYICFRNVTGDTKLNAIINVKLSFLTRRLDKADKLTNKAFLAKFIGKLDERLAAGKT